MNPIRHIAPFSGVYPTTVAQTVLLILCIAYSAISASESTPLDDEELSGISGADGISIVLHLNLTSSVQVKLGDESNESIVSLDEFGGVLDLASVRLDVASQPSEGGNYLQMGLPEFVGVKNFGFDLNQTQPRAGGASLGTSNYGQFRMDGSGSMAGSLLIWGQ